MRTKKDPEERREEIIEAARALFSSRGIAETSVSDIVKAVGVSQGAFYWYFPSKEAVLNAVVERMADSVCGALLSISSTSEIPALEKIAQMRGTLFDKKGADTLLVHFHRPENKEFHDRLIAAVTHRLIPAFAQVIKEGVAEGVFDSRYPDEAAVFFVYALQTLHEQDLFDSAIDKGRRVDALFDFALKGLGCSVALAASSID